MEYDIDDITKSFFARTYSNLIQYFKDKKEFPDTHNQETTMIINSLLGLLVFIQQNKKYNSKLQQAPLEYILNKSNFSNLRGEKKAIDFFRHMRNSIAHGHCLDRFKINNHRQITHITFKDFYNKSRTFEVELGLSDMLYIIKILKKIVVG